MLLHCPALHASTLACIPAMTSFAWVVGCKGKDECRSGTPPHARSSRMRTEGLPRGAAGPATRAARWLHDWVACLGNPVPQYALLGVALLLIIILQVCLVAG